MTRKRQNHRAVRFAVCSALAAVLVTGCAGSNHMAKAGKYSSQANVSASQKKLDRVVEKAERAVERNPNDAGSRISLADAYLQAGRFDSAAATYNDAIALGDSSPRTSLSLALANIGSGHDREAVAILDDAGDSLPAGDLGLALALAGETSRGVAILSDALRNGEDTPKLRQNLAYAYALDGRWREARVMAAQDVPADQLDARISSWAVQGKPEDYQKRVAGLLGAPVRSDSGQPASIALNGAPAPAWSNSAAAEPVGELPPLEQPAPASYSYSSPVESPPVAQAPVETARVSSVNFADAFSEPAADESEFVSRPVVQPAPARRVAGDQPADRPKAHFAADKSPKDCTHLVQLGSFSSESNAKRAWKIFQARNPELRNYELQITPAVVRGKNYWRVAAAGFDKRAAIGLCSSVKSRGGGCFAYSADRQLPGTLPAKGSAGPMMARR
ncbi:MAG: SPOR domain-containing protein [Novosphingobium sp.]|nr:SPOR domain-containing protein [Novosphingobium sp.]MCP5401216.1 SPOR domain-containing protein [Novosphingobium sp.]